MWILRMFWQLLYLFMNIDSPWHVDTYTGDRSGFSRDLVKKTKQNNISGKIKLQLFGEKWNLINRSWGNRQGIDRRTSKFQEAGLVTNYIVDLSSYRPSTVSIKVHFTGLKQTWSRRVYYAITAHKYLRGTKNWYGVCKGAWWVRLEDIKITKISVFLLWYIWIERWDKTRVYWNPSERIRLTETESGRLQFVSCLGLQIFIFYYLPTIYVLFKNNNDILRKKHK